MSRTLNLVDRLLAQGRKLQRLGAIQAALRLFGRLTAIHNLPPRIACRVQQHLALIHLRRRHYAKARRHLAALLVHEPDNAAHHYHMARAAAADRRCAPGRALEHCRQAASLAPRNVSYLSTLGILAIRQGREDGLDVLRRAAALAPHNPRVLERLARGLCLLGRAEEARAALLAALFRNGKDVRFRRLWDAFQFEQLHHRQARARQRKKGDEAGPVVLPFVRLVSQGAADDVRVDGPTVLPGPHRPRPLPRPDQRHAL
jgi:tetratricopeptide (TPR) repeat protein